MPTDREELLKEAYDLLLNLTDEQVEELLHTIQEGM